MYVTQFSANWIEMNVKSRTLRAVSSCSFADYVFNTVVFLRTTPEGLIQNDDVVCPLNTFMITTSSVKHVRKRNFYYKNIRIKDSSL